MPAFKYIVFENGKRRSGVVTAAGRAEAAVQLKLKHMIVLKLENAGNNAAAAPANFRSVGFRLSGWINRLLVRPLHVETALRQLAQIVKAGVPIMTALESVGAQAPRPLARIFAAIIARIRNGQSLEKSLWMEAAFFGRITIGLIGVGEANGALDAMLRYSAELMERSRKVKLQIRSAMAYPAMVMLGAIAMGYYMVRKVIPQIMQFIGAKNPSSLPAVTQYLIYTTEFLEINGIFILLLPPATIAAFVMARRNPRIAPAVDGAILWLPPIGKALRDYANTMWCRTLGALLGSGIDILAALELVGSTLGNAAYAARFDSIRRQVRLGASLSRAFREQGMQRLCPMATAMIAVSENSGGMDESLLHVADYCEDQLTRRVAWLTRMIEPVIFVLVGGMVGFVYFAFFLAMLAAANSAAGH